MLPPGPRGWPVLGMLLAVKRDPIGVFMSAARQFGDVAYFQIGPRRGFLITNPDDVRHVLQDNARNYHKSPLYEKLRMFLGNGLLTSEDDFWLGPRRRGPMAAARVDRTDRGRRRRDDAPHADRRPPGAAWRRSRPVHGDDRR